MWILFRPDDLPVPIQRSEQQQLKNKDSRRRLPSSNSSSSEEEIDVPVRRHRRRTSSLKVLKRLRSTISAVRAKSLPLIKPTMFTKSKRRSVQRSEDEDEEDEEEATRKLLPGHETKSEVLLREDTSDPASQDDSLTANLPPPPPLPPFAVTLDLETEEDGFIDLPSKHSKVETNTGDPFRDRIVKQNSGRRVKVLEKFAKIWEHSDRDPQHRERGGADYASPRSNCSKAVKLSSTDVYSRFRGSLQHTLARRETFQARRGSKTVYSTGTYANMDRRRSNLLARLRCNNVPPSYRLLANIELQRRSASQIHPHSPPAPPPPPPPPSVPWSQSSAPTVQGQRHCSICNRSVQQSPSSSESSIDREDARRFSAPRIQRTSPVAFWRERMRSRGDYLPCNRSTSVPKSSRRS